MVTIPYLCTRSGRFYFRRRIPQFSTYNMPVMFSLGTTDHSAATRLCVQLTSRCVAFFKAELARCVASVHRMRMVKGMAAAVNKFMIGIIA
ncbi:DUF6538 domain-containing protein [Sulfitobacter maritimus]|uniref:DUF6538 domain-containing protein n=1 Tax=Sulfitobacter maritimus TaxID=2741719 RepID=UPI003CCD31E1